MLFYIKGDAFPLSIVNEDPVIAMDQLRMKILKPELPRQFIRVERQSPTLVRDLFKMMKRGDIDIRRELDIEFVNEDGIDAKGLTKEYLNLVLQSMIDGKGGYVLFEGRKLYLILHRHRCIILCNVNHLHGNYFMVSLRKFSNHTIITNIEKDRATLFFSSDKLAFLCECNLLVHLVHEVKLIKQ